jgi:ferritin-like metal-binding protein YciE
VKTLPKMAKTASSEELADAFNTRKTETEGHVERIEKAFETLGKTARAKKCEAMEGLTKEGAQVMEDAEKDGVMDAGLIAGAQSIGHCEIARYGTLIAWAARLNLADAAAMLEQNLAEEEAADEKLTSIAETVNTNAPCAEAA